MFKPICLLLTLLLCLGTLATAFAEIAHTPLHLHGALHVEGRNLVDQNGAPIQLHGMSTHGLAWFPQFVNPESFRTLRDSWNVNCVRLALYTAERDGYCTGGDQLALKQLVCKGVNDATALGLYVIVDWHILSDGNPLEHKDEALAFFAEISDRYRDSDNVLYEICNEPNAGSTWAQVVEYANEVIPVIRQNDSDAVILVGTPSWCQEVNRPAKEPLAFDNVMYVLHFYASSHTVSLRDRMQRCLDSGLPVFMSEFGICDASGDGAIDYKQAERWKELIEQYNVSYVCWNLANHTEASSVILPNCTKTSGWTDDDLSEQGRWVVEWFRSEPK